MPAFRIPFAAIAATLLISPVAARGQSDPARAAVQRAVSAWSSVRTVRAEFTQTVTNALTGTSANAVGSFQQRRPNLLSVRFQSPDGDRIVADGQWLWLYLPTSTPGQVIKQAQSAGGSGTVDITGTLLDHPFDKYNITDAGADTVGGRPVRAVMLSTKPNGPTEFSRAKVWIDDADGYIRQFDVSQSNGVTRRVRLTALQVNGPTDDSAFRFVVPQGVRVVTR